MARSGCKRGNCNFKRLVRITVLVGNLSAPSNRMKDIWSGVWRSQPPPPPPNGMVWYGVGGGGEGWGPLELQLEKRPGVTDQASIVRKPYASHKSYNVAQ